MTDYQSYSNNKIFNAREKLKEIHGDGFFDIIDHYPLYACPQTLLRYSFIFEIVRKISNRVGNICEFGTWKGATAILIAKLIEEIEPMTPRKVLVFDNFSGLPKPTIKDGKKAEKFVGSYKGDYESMLEIIDTFDLNHRLKIIKGDANETIPDYFTSDNPELISLAYFDFDLYDPTMTAWNSIKERIHTGSMLIFDEGLDTKNWIGECLAVKEIINDLKKDFEYKLIKNDISNYPQIIIELI